MDIHKALTMDIHKPVGCTVVFVTDYFYIIFLCIFYMYFWVNDKLWIVETF